MKKFNIEVKLAREMTLLDATLIGVGAMIGAGIFVLIGIAAGVAGPALIITFALNGFVALFTAMSYAELGSCYHDAGGGYLWVKEGLPKWNGFLSGWMSWFAHAVACSLYAIGFGAYFDHVFTELGIHMVNFGFLSPQKILAVIVAVIFGYINFRGASEAGKIGNLVTIAKIIILLIFIGFGLELIVKRGDLQSTFSNFMPHGWSGIFKGMGLTFIAFQGFEVISQSSEEIINPKKNIPRAIFLSLLIVIPIYILVAIAALGSVNSGDMTPWDYLASHKEIALVEVSRQFFRGGGVVLLIGGLISTMSALNATIYSSSRVAYAMGKDRNFPKFFSKVNKKTFTPQWGIFGSLIIVIIMTVSLPIEDVASAADIMFLLLFLQVNLALIRLRKKRPDLDRGFRTPLFPYLSILGIFLLLFLAVYMFNYSLTAWFVTIIWIGIGLLVYYFYASKREIEHIRRIRTLDRIEKQDYTILVCLSNPNSVESLTNVAVAIAKNYNSEIIFLNVIEVPENQQLVARMAESSIQDKIIHIAEEYAEKYNVNYRSIIKLSHRISQGILETAVEENSNFIIIGTQKQSYFVDRLFSSYIYNALQNSTSEVALLHGNINRKKIKRIVIPFGDNIHTNLAFELAPRFVNFYDAELISILVVDPRLSQYEQDLKITKFKKMINEIGINSKIEIVYELDVVIGIIKIAAQDDLVLMAGRTGSMLELLFSKSLSQEITEKVNCPVLWVKEYEEKRSLWNLLIRPFNLSGDSNEK